MQVCREGPAAGMMVVFGGRTAENKSLKDSLAFSAECLEMGCLTTNFEIFKHPNHV